MSYSEQTNVGARLKSEFQFVVQTTQTSAAEAADSTGTSVDRLALSRHYYSAKAIVVGKFIGSSTAQTAILIPTVQHSSDGTSWESHTTGAGVTFTGTTEDGEVEVDVNLIGARRYVRISLPAPTFSDCSSGSYFDGSAAFIFGGADELPAA
jgi:hypothetical protein